MSVIGFPNPVNEVAARSVAGGVVVLAVLTLVLGTAVDHAWLWLSVLLAAGFVARVLSGPPKRFAQAIGATLTIAAVVVLALGHPLITIVLLGLLIVAATLESVFGLCLGCRAFALLMRAGVIPEQTCAACADISLRRQPVVTPR